MDAFSGFGVAEIPLKYYTHFCFSLIILIRFYFTLPTLFGAASVTFLSSVIVLYHALLCNSLLSCICILINKSWSIEMIYSEHVHYIFQGSAFLQLMCFRVFSYQLLKVYQICSQKLLCEQTFAFTCEII